jgi:hypothetical protein
VWAYKYSTDTEGIDIHGDDAEVNVNIWLTPTAAMEAQEGAEGPGGGLVVYTQPAPLEWNFDAFNEKEQLVRRCSRQCFSAHSWPNTSCSLMA